MTKENSYHTILRSSSIMGAASVINVLSGLVRMKAAAVLLGPAGVGLIGVYQNLISTAATVSAIGFGTVGTRQIATAQAKNDADDIAAARRALFWGTLMLAVLGAAGFFLLRDQIAIHILADPIRGGEVGWLAIGVALTVMAGSQTALLNGLRRIGDLARIQVASGLLGTLLGITALLIWREGGLLVLVLVGPLTTFILGHWYVAKLGRINTEPTPLHILAGQWRVMAQLGIAFMLSALVTGLGHLAVRAFVQNDLGLDGLGQFQAAWTIGMTYLTFVLGAMAADYYPRLTGCIDDKPAACRLINEQTEIALLLAGPMLIALLAAAPWVIRLLYTSEFAPAVDILRWQLIGDIFKVLSWPLGFALLAAGAGKTLVFTETAGVSIFVLGVAIGLPYIGIVATGTAFLAMYIVYLPLVLWLARRSLGFAWTPAVKKSAAILISAALIVAGVGYFSDMASALFGFAVAAAFGLHTLARLGAMADLTGPVGHVSKLSRRVMGKLGRIK